MFISEYGRWFGFCCVWFFLNNGLYGHESVNHLNSLTFKFSFNAAYAVLKETNKKSTYSSLSSVLLQQPYVNSEVIFSARLFFNDVPSNVWALFFEIYHLVKKTELVWHKRSVTLLYITSCFHPLLFWWGTENALDNRCETLKIFGMCGNILRDHLSCSVTESVCEPCSLHWQWQRTGGDKQQKSSRMKTTAQLFEVGCTQGSMGRKANPTSLMLNNQYWRFP